MTIHPRALLTWSACALGAGLLSTNPWHRLIILLAAVDVAVVTHRHERRVRGIVTMAAVAVALSTLVNMLTSHSGTHVLAVVPAAVPGVNGPITMEAVVYGACIGLGVVVALATVLPGATSMDSDDIVDALPRRLERVGACVAQALNLAPRFARSVTSIRESRRHRGWTSGRPAGITAVIVPAFVGAIEDSTALAEAMAVRGFGSGPRGSARSRAWTRADVIVTLTAVAALVATVAGRMVGDLADWYPFPTLTFPPMAVTSIVAAALLATPAVMLRR